MNQEKFANGRDCLFSRVKGTCDACHGDVERLHILTRQFGWFCDQCCPCCRPATGDPHLSQTTETPAPVKAAPPSLPVLVIAACLFIDRDGAFSGPSNERKYLYL
jgi:hypothetical protein